MLPAPGATSLCPRWGRVGWTLAAALLAVPSFAATDLLVGARVDGCAHNAVGCRRQRRPGKSTHVSAQAIFPSGEECKMHPIGIANAENRTLWIQSRIEGGLAAAAARQRRH